MKRRLLNLLRLLSLVLLTGMSLVLCVAVCALWVRSYFASDRLRWCPVSQSPDGFVSGEYMLDSQKGVFRVSAIRRQYDKAGAPALYETRRVLSLQKKFANHGWISREPDDLSPSGWGFSGWTTNKGGPGHRSRGVGWSTPYWFLFLLCSLWAGLQVVLFLRRRPQQDRLGLCPACGYDLRATPGRCPECGAVAGHQATTTSSSCV